MREGQGYEGDGVPVGAEVEVPGGDGSGGGKDEPDGTAEHRVEHGAGRGDAGGEVGSHDAEEGAVSGGEEKRFGGSELAGSGKEAEGVEEGIGSGGGEDDEEEADKERPEAAEKSGLVVHFV